MEVILNTCLKPFNFTMYVKGRMVTIQLIPGTSRVKKEHIKELRKIDMFLLLEEDGVLEVGVKDKKDTIDAPELGKGLGRRNKAPIRKPLSKKGTEKKGTAKKVTPKPKKGEMGDSGVGDLEEL